MGVEEIKRFEACYFKWRTAWAHSDAENIVEFSKGIKELIQLGEQGIENEIQIINN
jgi:hypothetical protein